MRIPTKAQASAELIAVLGMALIVMLVFVVLSSNLLSDINVNRNYDDARNSVQKLANAADTVFAQGSGASTIVQIVIPPNANMSVNASFIGQPANGAGGSNSNTININVEGTDVISTTREPVSGSFPTAPGTYNLKVASQGSQVVIGTYFFNIDQASVFVSMARGETRTVTLNFVSVSTEYVGVTLSTGSPDWANLYPSPPAPTLDIQPAALNFGLPPGGGQSVTLTFTSIPQSGGIYTDYLYVNATGVTSGVPETAKIPITVDVQA